MLLNIADLQDRRLPDSLYPYFTHKDATYRREAVLAFGSIQESSAVGRIGALLLKDGDPSVRKAAAFALGQTQHPSAESMLLDALEKENTAEVTAKILEAYGKTTGEWDLDPDAFLSDSLTAAGLGWSIYRAGLRGKAGPAAVEVAKELLNNRHTEATRMGAAHFFARGARDFGAVENMLISSARGDGSPEVRMALAAALGKIPTDSTLAALKDLIKTDDNSGVVINALKALGSFPYGRVKHYLYQALNNRDVNAGIAASEVIITLLGSDDWIEVSSLTTQVTQWRIQANLYEAALKAGQNPDLAREVRRRYEAATDPFQKAALLGSLKHFPAAWSFVTSELRQADTAVVRSAAAATLLAMNHSDQFNKALRSRFAETFQQLMESQDDPAVLGTIAMALGDSALGYRNILRDPSFLLEAKKKLKLPEHNESLQAIEAAIAHFENRKGPATLANDYNHAIDWALVKTIPEDQRAIIKTTRGNIIIRLLVNEAPGSVANFVWLARNGYFDKKVLHRVVPNFVVQDGCKRGDGWGSEDYSIRSEFSPRRYRAGSVGMASAGKDTEGTQWFITHSPTPHLDGRYTIFAELIDGMRVLDFLQVGDEITGVEIVSSGDQ